MKTQTLILALALSALTAQAQDFPRAYKWLNNKEIAFSQDGSFTDSGGYVVTVGKKFTKTAGVNAPEKFADFPLQPEGAVNLTYSPDSTKLAFNHRRHRNRDEWLRQLGLLRGNPGQAVPISCLLVEPGQPKTGLLPL